MTCTWHFENADTGALLHVGVMGFWEARAKALDLQATHGTGVKWFTVRARR